MKDTSLQSISEPGKVLSKVTHQGKWIVEKGIEIECYVTDDKKRLMSLRGTARAMDLTGGGSRALLKNLLSKWIEPYLSDQLKSWVNRASMDNITKICGIKGPAIIPFEANLFVDVCKAYLKAKNDGVLSKSQSATAERLLNIMIAFAKVGIDAMVDEITGYQEERQKDELQLLLEKYVSPSLLPWAKTFDDEFFEQIFRLRGWSSFKTSGRRIPRAVGGFINDIVYCRLPDKVLEALKEKTPKSKAGNNTARYHQSLTEDIGRKHLEKHLHSVITLMKLSKTWNEFLYMLDNAYPRRGKQQVMWNLILD